MKIVNGMRIFGVVSLLLIGCAKTSSDNIKTSGFYATYSISSAATSPTIAICSASFSVEQGGTYIELGSSDTVTCNGQTMTKSVVLGIVSYSANLTATVGSTYTVLLTRSGESPYSASVTLPAAIATTAPSVGFSQAKGLGLTYAWTASSNASDAMYLTGDAVTSGDLACPNRATFTDSPPENGSGAFSTTEMTLRSGGTTGACAYKISWERARVGTMPSGLNGTITAVQTVSVTGTLN